MSEITVEPDTFEMVRYDAAAIRSLALRMLEETGLEVDSLTIRIDETTPLARAVVVSEDPFVVDAQGGSFEDTRRPRSLSEDRTMDTLGRLFLRTRDRRRPDFADAPADEELSLRQWTAWDVYSVGRLVRLGHPGQRPRRLYQFRSRHGFTDVADVGFERLWSADEELSWDQIEALSAEAASGLDAA